MYSKMSPSHVWASKEHPDEMGEAELSAFLGHLPGDKHVAASTQNQALSAVLFLYKKVLNNAGAGIMDSRLRRSHVAHPGSLGTPPSLLPEIARAVRLRSASPRPCQSAPPPRSRSPHAPLWQRPNPIGTGQVQTGFSCHGRAA